MLEAQTKKSFSDKWHKNEDLAFNETLKKGSEIQNWILSRNGWNDLEGLKDALRGRKKILDAGCGNGRVTALLRDNSSFKDTSVTGIDLVAAKVAEKNLLNCENVFFSEEDLTQDLTHLGKFDFIYSQEVLHHTDDPKKSFMNLCDLLDDNGVISIYVYKKKAPAREFVDDFIREKISDMSYEEALSKCDQITALGKALSDLDFKISVPAVDLLEIEEGEYDIQRFLYHFFAKCFWSNAFSFEENSVINYDWYHPQNCSRHTLEEIKAWFEDAGLKVTHEFVDHYGITMHGQKCIK